MLSPSSRHVGGHAAVNPVASFLRGPSFAFCLAVFDSRRGQHEGEEYEKVLSFFPTSVALTTRTTVVGLAQAVTSFADTFAQAGGHMMELLPATLAVCCVPGLLVLAAVAARSGGVRRWGGPGWQSTGERSRWSGRSGRRPCPLLAKCRAGHLPCASAAFVGCSSHVRGSACTAVRLAGLRCWLQTRCRPQPKGAGHSGYARRQGFHHHTRASVI